MPKSDAKQFFDMLFKEKPPQHFILLWHLNGHRSVWFTETGIAADYVKDNPEDLYFGVGTSAREFGPTKRCTQNQISGIPGLYVDIDISDHSPDSSAHKGKEYPETLEAALDLANIRDLAPTIIVSSGYGIHCYWLFDKPWLFENEIERFKAKELTKRMNEIILHRAKLTGKTIDSVFDLSRVLRPPGSLNCKKQNPVKVEFIKKDGPSYTKETLSKELLAISSYLPATPSPSLTQAPLPKAQAKASQSPAKPVVAAKGKPKPGLTIDLDVMPDAEKMMELATIFENFTATWNHSRTDLPSTSEYDMSLANFGAKINMSDQQIANMIIAFRRRHSLEPEKCKRVAYMADTILKAKKNAGDESIRDIEYLNRTVGTEYEKNNFSEEALKVINKKINNPGFIQILYKDVFGPGPKDVKYTMQTAKGNVYGGHDFLDTSPKFRLATQNATGVRINLKTKEFNEFSQLMSNIAIQRNMGLNVQISEKIGNWVEEYIGRYSRKDFKDSVISKEPFYENGFWFMYFDPFKNFLWHKEEIKDNDLKQYLHEEGFKDVRKRVVLTTGTAPVSRIVYQIPKTKYSLP